MVGARTPVPRRYDRMAFEKERLDQYQTAASARQRSLVQNQHRPLSESDVLQDENRSSVKERNRNRPLVHQ